MNYKAIFKMEMFKFYKESPFFLVVMIIAIINNLSAILLAVVSNIGIDSFATDFPFTLIYVIIPFSIIAAIIVIAIYPIQSFSVDYKNNVMATIISSGVDRVKLYFTKVSAIIINSIVISTTTLIIPFIIIGAFSISDISIFKLMISFFESIVEYPLVAVYILVAGLSTITVIIYAAIELKGSFMSILLFIAFSVGISIVNTFIIVFIPTGYTLNQIVNIIYQVVVMILFVFLAIKKLKNQDL